jgi:hypothetical protein
MNFSVNFWTPFFDFLKENKLFTFAIVILLISISEKIGPIKLSVSEKFKTILFYFGVTILIASIVPHLGEVYQSTVNNIKNENNIATPTPTPTPTLIPTPTLTTSEAINIIDSYLDTKRLMLSRKYSTEAAKKYTTGKLYKDLLESISKLKSSNTYYIYGLHRLKESGDIALVGNQPTIKVQVTENFDFYKNNLKESTREYCAYFTYTFTIDEGEGIWKLSDYFKNSNC